MMAAVLHPLTDVVAAVARCEPATVMEVLAELGGPWEDRGTVRNRLYELVELGLLIDDEARPLRFAINHLGGSS